MNRFAASSLLWFACAGMSVAAFAAPPLLDTSGQRIAIDAYQLCAQLNLPENFARAPDPQRAAAAAVDHCREEELVLAGQFALENPGTTQTQEFMRAQRRAAVTGLAAWMRNLRPQQPAVPAR